MKLTKNKLKEIIREEIQKLNENFSDDFYGLSSAHENKARNLIDDIMDEYTEDVTSDFTPVFTDIVEAMIDHFYRYKSKENEDKLKDAKKDGDKDEIQHYTQLKKYYSKVVSGTKVNIKFPKHPMF